MRYHGGCHCGNVSFKVELDLDNPITCNCSYCSKRGTILAFTPAENFTLVDGQDSLREYRFNTRQIQHLFCSECGVASFAHGAMPDGMKVAVINVRCLDGVDIGSLNISEVDGRSR